MNGSKNILVTTPKKDLSNKKNLKNLNRCIFSYLKKILKNINLFQKSFKSKEIEKGKKIYEIAKPNKTSIYKKLLKNIENEKTKTEKVQIVLSNKMKKYEHYFKNYKILNGKTIFFSVIEQILKEIFWENELALQDIFFLTDYYKEKNINLIRNLAPKVKTVNVVTEEIEKYKIIEEMLQEQGNSVTVSNNKRKSLKKAKIIINLDFELEKLNKYIIFRNALIINLTQEKLIKLKGFEGITIRDIQLKLKKEENDFIVQNGLDEFNQLEIHESLQNKFLLPNGIEIEKLYGNNGTIDNKELENLIKSF